ncbi:medium-chain fatty acid-CoA ligase faa2, partial [Coemansia aciculifera]
MSCSIEVPGAPAIPGETKPRIAANKADGQLTANREGVSNMHDNFLRGMELAGKDAACLGHRPFDADGKPGPYSWMTFGELNQTASNVGSGLTKLGVAHKSCIGLFSPNRIEWSIVEHASYIYNYVTVPMYDTLGVDAIKYMAVETEMSLIAIAPEKLAILFELWPTLPLVKTVVVFGQIPVEYADSTNIPEGAKLMTLDDVATLGANDAPAPLPETPATANDACTICYTSGTTGTPKGVVLSHMCFLSTVNCVSERMALGFIPHFDNKD